MSGGKRFWQNANCSLSLSSLGHVVPVQRALFVLLLGGQQLFRKLRDAYIERIRPRSLRKATLPVVKRYIHTRAVPFALTVTGHGSEFCTVPVAGGFLFARGAHWQWVEPWHVHSKENILLPHFRCTMVPL